MNFVTKNILSNWSSGGCDNLIHTAVSFLRQSSPPNVESFRALCLDVIRSTLRGDLSPDSASSFFTSLYSNLTNDAPFVKGEIVSAMIPPIPVSDNFYLPNVLADELWLMDIETDQSMITDASGIIPHSHPIYSGFANTSKPLQVSEVRQRLYALTKELMKDEFIPHIIMHERFEPEFLEATGLIQSHVFLSKKMVRLNTVMLYKQQKFNLLREESEGYSKLITELTANLPPLCESEWFTNRAKVEADRKVAVEDRVVVVLSVIKSLIGYFDLDPNRVLDIILDVFTANVTDQWDFFVRLLECSPWKVRKVRKRVPPPSPKNAMDMALDEVPSVPDTSESVEESADGLVVVQEDRSVCASVLGFKFAYYNFPETTTAPPPQLFWVAALLIKHGLVQLEALYPHLSPSDEDVEKEYDDYVNELKESEKETGQFKESALANSVLSDDMAPMSRTEKIVEDSSSKPAKPATSTKKINQKCALARCLMGIGARPQATRILSRLPFLVSLDPEIAEFMCRALHIVVEPLYSNIRIPQIVPPTDSIINGAKETPAIPVNTLNHKFCPVFERVQCGSRRKHFPKVKFFYQPWKDGLPVINDANELLRYLKQTLPLIGPHLHRDVVLMAKLIRVGRSHIESAAKDVSGDLKVLNGIKDSWASIIAKYMFPAISQIYANPGLNQELWSLIKLFPYQARYALYGEWKHDTYKIPEVALAGAACRADTRFIMRRLSKDNVKQYGRRIGKVVHSNPTIAFSIILDQLQSYDNQITYVVDASRYLTDLEFDVLSFCLIEALSNPRKERMKEDGMSVAKWIIALSSFTGTLCRKHGIELQGLLTYIANKLSMDQVYDLVVLQDIIGNMAGVRHVDDATESQFEALAGGETLRREALMFESVRTTRKPSMRLLNALLDCNLIKAMGVLIAQQRRDCVFRDETKEVKISSTAFDHCHKVLLQYFEFLSILDKAKYAEIFPSVKELCLVYGIEPEIAFHILRPTLSWYMQSQDSLKIQNPKLSQLTQNEGISSPATPTSANGEAPESMAMDLDGEPDTKTSEWFTKVVEEVIPIIPATVWETISPHFYVTFWQLSLYDIYVPSARYRLEFSRQQKLLQQLEEESRSGGVPTTQMLMNDPVLSNALAANGGAGLRNTAAAATKRKKEKEKINLMISQLQRELKIQEENHQRVMARLEKEKVEWFQLVNSRKDIVIQLMQYCFIPRCMLSTSDATYCAKLIFQLHSLATPNFSSLLILDRVLSKELLQSLIISSTENEARNFGHFLAVTLQVITAWHHSPERFAREAKGDGLPGFQRRWNPGPSPTHKIPDADLIDFEDFRRAMSKWHSKLGKAFETAMLSGEYMQIRNSLIILDRVQEYFPLLVTTGKSLEVAVKSLQGDSREDIKLMAQSYGVKLKNSRSKWIEPRKFAIILTSVKSGGVETKVVESVASKTEREEKKGLEVEKMALDEKRSGASSTLTTQQSNNGVEKSEPSRETEKVKTDKVEKSDRISSRETDAPPQSGSSATQNDSRGKGERDDRMEKGEIRESKDRGSRERGEIRMMRTASTASTGTLRGHETPNSGSVPASPRKTEAQSPSDGSNRASGKPKATESRSERPEKEKDRERDKSRSAHSPERTTKNSSTRNGGSDNPMRATRRDKDDGDRDSKKDHERSEKTSRSTPRSENSKTKIDAESNSKSVFDRIGRKEDDRKSDGDRRKDTDRDGRRRESGVGSSRNDKDREKDKEKDKQNGKSDSRRTKEKDSSSQETGDERKERKRDRMEKDDDREASKRRRNEEDQRPSSKELDKKKDDRSESSTRKRGAEDGTSTATMRTVTILQSSDSTKRIKGTESERSVVRSSIISHALPPHPGKNNQQSKEGSDRSRKDSTSSSRKSIG
ncbi:THO complex subunit 2 [Nowakowskiella sp. JEL0407]|nr:THO complex subunit 2 [Nowakowskiella sp. JEL0407]